MQKNRFFIGLSLLLLICGNSLAQQSEGSLTIHADPKIDQIMQYYTDLSTENPGLYGYRIQIFFDSGNQSKQNALTIKENFNQNGIDEEVYLIFEEPYYKVRIGNFRTKMEATGVLNSMIGIYPEAFVVPDYIEFPKLYDEKILKNQIDSIQKTEFFDENAE